MPDILPGQVRSPNVTPTQIPDLSETVPIRPPSFCTGCPERPIFAAMKLIEQDLGKHQITGDIGCHLFATLATIRNWRLNNGLWSWTCFKCSV